MSKKVARLTFKQDDFVKWSSQASGSWKMKMGQVVEVVPSGQKTTTRGDWGYLTTRGHESYVVRVDRGEGRKPEFYWPRVSALELAAQPPPEAAPVPVDTMAPQQIEQVYTHPGSV